MLEASQLNVAELRGAQETKKLEAAEQPAAAVAKNVEIARLRKELACWTEGGPGQGRGAAAPSQA